MKNVMDIDGYKALIAFDPDSNQFRVEFVDVNGGADFYAADDKSLKCEGKISLKVFLNMCREDGVEPHKKSFRQADGAPACCIAPAGGSVCCVARQKLERLAGRCG